MSDLHQYLLAPKKSVSFGAFLKTATRRHFPDLILVFTCCESHKQDEERENQETKGNETIGEQTSDQEMAIDEKAYFDVFGGIRNVYPNKEWFVKFRGEQCDRKWMRIEVLPSDEHNSAQFKTKEKEDLCLMPMSKLTVESSSVTEFPKHYCGILLKDLSDMPEDVLPDCLVCFEEEAAQNISTPESWDRPEGKLDTMWKEVARLSPESEEQFFHTIIHTLRSPDLINGAGHLACRLSEGRKMIKAPIDLSSEFHVEVFENVAHGCSDKVCWKKLARRLGMQHNWIENIEHDHNRDEQCYQMLASWTQRTGHTTSNAASLEKLLLALTGMKCFGVVHCVVERITKEVKKSENQPPFRTGSHPM